MTDNEINKMCAEALGECWHELRWWASLDDSDQSYMECRVCERRFGNNPNKSNPDYCTDRNALARLVGSVDKDGWDFNNAVRRLAFPNAGWDWNPSIKDALLLPPKTIALACLVALGKITLEEAKDAN